jgi:alcohol dehydrogenase class IV
MMLAALLSGMALANAGLGAVHGFAAPIGGMFGAPHGAVCAALLAPVMEANIRAMGEGSGGLDRYREVASLLTGRPGAMPADGVAWVRGLCRELGIRPLGAYGVAERDVGTLVEKAAEASSMKGNPVPLGREQLESILRAAL